MLCCLEARRFGRPLLTCVVHYYCACRLRLYRVFCLGCLVCAKAGNASIQGCRPVSPRRIWRPFQDWTGLYDTVGITRMRTM